MDQPVHAVEVDERAEVDDVGDLAVDDVAGVEPVEDRLAHLLALVLEHRAAREHDVVPGAVELDHLAAKLLAQEETETEPVGQTETGLLESAGRYREGCSR